MLEDQDLRSIQEVRAKIALAHEAFLKYREYTQEQVDQIVDRMAAAARAHSESLARLAVEETGYGNVRDKVAKNLLNSDLLHRVMRPMKTVGIIREDREQGIVEIAEPVGVVAAILPTTNPTSTAIYKSLISLKSRNAIVLSPHPRAIRCTCETAALLSRAAEEAGAPKGIVQCLGEATIQGTNELMRHRQTGVILSTGGPGIVRAAYSSGKPALGVGPGNVAVLLEASADVDQAIASVVEGKSFDYGTVCSSEQTVVAEAGSRDRMLAALEANGAYLCDAQQTQALEKLLVTPEFRINPDCVGQAPGKIAEMAGFSVPAETRVLVVELQGVGREHPLSAEKLSPVLAVYFVRDFAEALDACTRILNFGGRGHTCGIYSKNEERIREFAFRMPAFRVLVNTPAPHGSTGITTNLLPSMTLGCGAIAGNSTSDNIGPMHLLNIKRIAYHVRDAEQAFQSEEGRAWFAGKPLPAAAAPAAVGSAASTGNAPAPRIDEAVGRYLAERGLASASAAGPPTVRPSVVSNPATAVVDRFLAKQPGGPAGSSTTESPGSASAHRAKSTATTQTASPPPPAPEVNVVGFVCEEDVRRARVEGRKIYIDKDTIVTPAAQDLADPGDVLVRTQ